MALVIYSSRTGRIRRILTDENPARPDRILRHKYPPATGESAEIIPGPITTLRRLQRKLNKLTGKTPANDRFVVYGTSGVVGRIFIGDPDAGDVIANRTVKQDNNARPRWRRNIADTSWERSVREINHDLDRRTRRKTFVNSQSWLDRQLLQEQTQAQIDAKRTARLAQLDAQIATLNAEKTARQGARP